MSTVSAISREDVRAIMKSCYQIQKLRIQVENQITSNFRLKLDAAKQTGTKSAPEDTKLITSIKDSFDLIVTDHVRATMDSKRAGKVPSMSEFRPTTLITEYTEFVMVMQHNNLVRLEKEHFAQLKNIVETFPIYTGFLSGVKGVGPAIAGVIISEFDIYKAEYPSSLWKYCFEPNTMIQTTSGAVEIKNITPGIHVFDKDGKPTKVLEVLSRKFSGRIIELKIIGAKSIRMTDEHPVLVANGGTENSKKHSLKNLPTKWIQAKDIKKGDLLVLPKNQFQSDGYIQIPLTEKAKNHISFSGDKIALTEDLMELFGVFVAEGCTTLFNEKVGDKEYQRGCIQIAINKAEKQAANKYHAIMEKYFGKTSMIEGDTTFRIQKRGLCITRAFQGWFGHLAQNKRLPDFIMGATPELAKAFFKGYLFGDGHIVKAGKSQGSIAASSASSGLIFQLQLLATKLDIFASTHMQVRSETMGIINGRPFNQIPERHILSIPYSESHKLYQTVTRPSERSARKVIDCGDHYRLQVNKIETHEVSDIEVFNLHTKNNTYLAQNIAVHNCGLDTGPDGKGRSKRKEHLIRVKYTDKAGNESEKSSITFNSFLKSKLMGVLAPSFLKQGRDSQYAAEYYNYKNRLMNHPGHKDKAKGHIHNMALRYMIKRFLVDLYKAWREMEGLAVAPEYSEEKLGIIHNIAA